MEYDDDTGAEYEYITDEKAVQWIALIGAVHNQGGVVWNLLHTLKRDRAQMAQLRQENEFFRDLIEQAGRETQTW